MSRIGEKIKSIRKTKNMSPKELAKKLGVTEKFINEVEAGRKVVSDNLLNSFSKVLGQSINDIAFSFEEENFKEEEKKKVLKNTSPTQDIDLKAPTNEVWNDALSSILRTIPVYGYDLNVPIKNRQLPIVSNKVEGFPADKVIYLQIEEDDMLGFRIAKGDTALALITAEIFNDSICLIDYNSRRIIRQIKRLDGNTVLLVSNKTTVRTETVSLKDIKVLAKLEKLEITL